MTSPRCAFRIYPGGYLATCNGSREQHENGEITSHAFVAPGNTSNRDSDKVVIQGVEYGRARIGVRIGEAKNAETPALAGAVPQYPAPDVRSAGTGHTPHRKGAVQPGDWAPPFTPIGGNNAGVVRDAIGQIVADTRGHEARAEQIAKALNAFVPVADAAREAEQRGEEPKCENCDHRPATEIATGHHGDTYKLCAACAATIWKSYTQDAENVTLETVENAMAVEVELVHMAFNESVYEYVLRLNAAVLQRLRRAERSEQ